MEYPKNWLGQFKKDYLHHGKYSLEVQVPHLARLAEFYVENYRRSRHWTDCVKAHALYNAISCRKPQFPGWKKQAFSVQQEYLGENSSLTFKQQCELTDSFENEIKEIRNQSRDDMKHVHVVADGFGDSHKGKDNFKVFFKQMKSISVNCSNRMAELAGKIIIKSVDILKPTSPPCSFEVIAIGSLARGEATPYSDLEYLFLVEEKSPEAVEYFERLAITTYFQIGNLGETTLDYMAINELKGWFEDKAMSGFKIDGLTEKAGNIPTGNGSSSHHNHFIVSPKDLAERYRRILNNPVEATALRGDLTAMMTYMRCLFAHRSNGSDLLAELRRLITNCKKNKNRLDVNIEMLRTDLEKFNFMPSDELRDKGFTANVKREVYRFPSIFLLDIAIVREVAATDSWGSLQVLSDNKDISAQLHASLELILAAATYMRLAAYLYHDSQDDRMSLVREMAKGKPNKDQMTKSQMSQSRRWFVPIGLFITMCVQMISLKRKLAKNENILKELRSLALDDDDIWARITTLYYTGRRREALLPLKDIYGDSLCDDPISVTQNMPSGQSEYETLYIISETLFWCAEYTAAQIIYKHMTSNNISDMRSRIADCYIRLGSTNEAVAELESITNKSAHVYYSLGHAHLSRREYKRSEQSYLQALQLLYPDISVEKQYDYYGDPIETDQQTDIPIINFATINSPEERLPKIINSSSNVIALVGSLGLVYSQQGLYTLAESYYRKSLHLISELYGGGSTIIAAADTLFNLGNNYRGMGQYHEAEYHYKQALATYRKLSQSPESSDIAITLYKLGDNYNEMEQHSEAEDHYKQALDIYRQLSPGVDNADIADTLCSLGDNSMSGGRNNLADRYLLDALAIFRRLPKETYLRHTAITLVNLSVNYRIMGQHEKAEEYHDQASACFREISSTDTRSGVAKELITIADKCHGSGKYIEAVECYRHSLDIHKSLSGDTDETADIVRKLELSYQAAGFKKKAVMETNVENLNLTICEDPNMSTVSQIPDFPSPVVSDTNTQNTNNQTQKSSEAEIAGSAPPQTKYRKTDP